MAWIVLWGSLDTAFSHIYGCSSRRWLEQKRFGLVMVGVVLLFMIATVGVPIAQSILVVSVVLLFACLAVIYARVPNRDVSWRAVWPGAVAATLAIVVVDYAFPTYSRESRRSPGPGPRSCSC